MTTAIFYSRHFSAATAIPGSTVNAFIEVFFVSPPAPSANIWVNNIADNFGGSTFGIGPLNGDLGMTIFFSANITPNSSTVSFEPAGLYDGCFRGRTGGPSYPAPTVPVLNNWTTLAPNTLTRIRYTLTLTVSPTAVVGTVINVPVRSAPTNAANLTAGQMMIDLGSDFIFNILSTPVTPPLSRTLTIVAPPCFSDEAFIKMLVDDHFEFAPVEAVKPNAILSSSTGERIPLKYAVRFNDPAFSFIRIQKDALGENCPNKTLYICRGHPLLIAGQTVNPEDLLGSAGIDEVAAETAEQGKTICTLVTNKRAFVDVQGLFVATWSEEGWQNAIRTEARFSNLKWSKIE